MSVLLLLALCLSLSSILAQQPQDLDPVVDPLPNVRPFCPTIGSTTRNARLQSYDPVKSFTEISGLALSPTQSTPSNNPVLYGISDGGGGERLGMFDSWTGQRLLTLQIPNNIITNRDWESMAIGSCGTTGVSDTCIYIADTGDNTARNNNGRRTGRDTSTPYRILKIREPLLADFNDNDVIPMSYLSLLTLDYRDASAPTDFADSEAMFIDHVGWGAGSRVGDIYLVTKWDESKRSGYNRLFKIPASVWPTVMDGSSTPSYSVKAVGSYNDPSGGLQQQTWTGADATYDGTLIALGTMDANYLFLRCPGATVEEALAAPGGTTRSCLQWNSPSPGQVETISWSYDGMRTINIPEGNNGAMGWTTFVYDSTTTTQTCPQMEWVDAHSAVPVRYCRSKEDGSMKPVAWCDNVQIAVTSPEEEVDFELVLGGRIDPTEDTRSNHETRRASRLLRSANS
jgi:hypothetical protein